mgnify:CR=1 FL=1
MKPYVKPNTIDPYFGDKRPYSVSSTVSKRIKKKNKTAVRMAVKREIKLVEIE